MRISDWSSDVCSSDLADATEELDVGAVELAGPLTDPEHVGRAVVPLAGEGVLAGERFLVAEDQRLVAREEVDLVEVGLGLGVDPAGPHEPQRPLDVVGQALVALALAARRPELLVPLRSEEHTSELQSQL